MENYNFGPNVIYFALGITEGRPQVHPRRTPGGPQRDPRTTPGAPQQDPRTTPGGPQGDPKGPGTSAGTKDAKNCRNNVF